MKSFMWRSLALLIVPSGPGSLILALLLLSGSACRRTEGPPPAVTLEQLPAALQKAFSKAKPEASEKLDSVLSALSEKDFSKALMTLQSVGALAGLNKEQADITAAGIVTLNTALQEAQSHGDETAAQTLQTYRATK